MEMSIRSRRYLVCVAAFALALAGVGAASGSPASVRVAGSRPSWARASNLVRRVDPASRVDFLVFLGWRDPAGVTAVASAVSDPDKVGCRIYFQRVPEPKTVKNRLHLDVEVTHRRGRYWKFRAEARVDAIYEHARASMRHSPPVSRSR
jgi:hypothetical protein